MAWIESHQSLLTHRKTGRLARLLGVTRPAAIGYLHALWWWCLDNAPDGDLTGIDAEDIGIACLWDGEPSEFTQCLIDAGFVDADDNGTAVHDWDDYAGKLLDRRVRDKVRKREWRRRPSGETETGHGRDMDVHVVSNGRPADGTRTSSGRDADVPLDVPRDILGPEQNRTDKNRTVSASTGFAEFWAAYPKKVGKAVAEQAWRKIRPDENIRAIILAGIDKAMTSQQWTKDGGQFIPNPSTWLNQRRWEDVYGPIPTAPIDTGTNQNGKRDLTISYYDKLMAEQQQQRLEMDADANRRLSAAQ